MRDKLGQRCSKTRDVDSLTASDTMIDLPVDEVTVPV